MRRVPVAVVAVILVAGVLIGRSSAQAPAGAAAAANIVRISKYVYSVVSTETSAAFYQGVFEIPLANNATALPMAQPIPDLVQKLTSVAAPATFRAAHFTIPGAADGFDFEQTEFIGPVRPAHQPRLQDPGASWVVFHVRDLDAAMVRIPKFGGTIISTGGRPVGNNGQRAIFAQDPNGGFLEIIQPATLPAGTTFVIASPRLAFVVADAEKAGAVYRDHFGLTVKMPGAWNDDQRMSGLPGLPGSKVRSATVTLPGKTLSWQFYEYGNIDRTPYTRHVPDPGAGGVAIEVRDIAAFLETVKASGGSVVSVGGKPVEGRNIAFARDANGVLLEVIQVAK